MRALFALTLASALALPCAAQRVTGEIVGTVHDPSQSVVPGANVVVIHEETGAKRVVTTDVSGFYRAPTLDIGGYRLEVSAGGFKTIVRRDLTLHVNEVLRIDLTLEVGAVNEQVSVQGAAPVIATETGEISNIVSARQVVDLPLNGRVFMQLGIINPGVNQNAYGASGGFTANGLPSPYVNVQMDSGEIMELLRPERADRSAGQLPAQRRFHRRVHHANLQLQRAVWQAGRSQRQHCHQVGHQHFPRHGIRVFPQSGFRRAQLLRG